MGEQPVSFRFENSIGRFFILLLFHSLMGSILGIVFAIGCGILVFLIAGQSPILLHPFFACSVFSLFFLFTLGFIVVNGMKGWFWSIKLDTNSITLAPFRRLPISIQYEEIEAIHEEYNQVTLKSANQELIIDRSKMPTKEGIIFQHQLANWSSQKIPDEAKASIAVLQGTWQARAGVGDSAEVTYHSLFIFRHYVRVDATGIYYHRWGKTITLLWSEIEAIQYVMDQHQTQFYIWTNNHQSPIVINGFGSKAFNEFSSQASYLFEKFDIPYEVKLPKWLTATNKDLMKEIRKGFGNE